MSKIQQNEDSGEFKQCGEIIPIYKWKNNGPTSEDGRPSENTLFQPFIK